MKLVKITQTSAVLCLLMALAGCSSLPSVTQLFAESDAANDNMNASGETPSNANGIVDIDANSIDTNNKSVDTASNLQFGSTDAFGSIVKPRIMSSSSGAYKGMPLTKHVGDYVKFMAQDLVSNMEYVTERTPVAVTHFSLIDSDLKETNLLGQQMAESFMHEFHKFRMPVVEFKATQFINVSPSGDYVLSRDFLDLRTTTPIQYVLTGTMTKHQGGYIVNARMLGMKSNVVVASAQSFIPFYVVDALLPSGSSRQNEIVDGVQIIRGE
jgi:TolB-like protein